MTTSAGTRSVTEARTMALAMFAEAVPCFFQLADPPCEKAALWVAHFAHEEPGPCTTEIAWPVCEEHRQAFQRTAHPFWRMWLQSPPLSCDDCGTTIRLDRFEAIS